ncbi:MAG: adenylate/guanylate cyclase domain-containing protein, partial [Gemmatimonadota bacterium]|nr:adenylate/guanylate cyclase domain-containing protein [Gemmatimonadota bacterium]
ADLRGFTALTEGMEPQAVIALLNECMERLSAAVETEGGVVDKYVGDEIMGVFGAPVPQPDHADRAVCAAVRMRRAMAELNAVRAARHEPPLAIGAGINSGSVVAGNMGSSDRLNYTVLGETVNLAARLCAAAGADEILVTAGTAAQVRARAEIAPLGPRRFKGFAADVEVSAVRDIPLTAGRRRVSGPAVRAVTTTLILAACLAAPGAARAQGAGGLPTLRGLGLGYESPSGRYQIAWSGQLDLELLSLSAPDIGLVKGNGTFLSPRLRLYTDMFAGDHLYGLLELSADGGEAPTRGLFEGRVEQAYLRVSNGGGTLAFQAGRFANPFGPYQARHLTPQDLFVRPSLPYDYRTVMSRTIVAADPAAFQSWQDRAGFFRPNGAPPVWQVPYPWGAMALGTVGRLSYRVAAVNSAPSSEPAAWYLDADGVRHPSWVGAVRVAVTPSLALEGSYDSGPYLGAVAPAALPNGRSRWSYRQTLWSGDVAYARGPVMADAELLDDRWDVPNAGTALHDLGYVASVQSDLAAGVFAALRWSYLDFRPWTDGSGRTWSDWDHDVARAEASLGYRIATNAGVLASALSDRQRAAGAHAQTLFAVRWWWAF